MRVAVGGGDTSNVDGRGTSEQLISMTAALFRSHYVWPSLLRRIRGKRTNSAAVINADERSAELHKANQRVNKCTVRTVRSTPRESHHQSPEQ